MTGRTVQEAVEAALDQLGVAETDAEIVVVEERNRDVRLSENWCEDQSTGAPGSAQGETTVTPAAGRHGWWRARASPTSWPFREPGPQVG